MPGNYQDVRHRVPDIAKAQSLLGFEAKVSVADGIGRTIEWHRALRETAAISQAAST
jgi:nucleoside-diphosphate-sugar epimerase